MNFNGTFGCECNPSFGSDVTVDGRLFLADGTDALPSLTYKQESTTGWDRSGTGEVSFVTSGAKRVRLNSSGLFATNATFTTSILGTSTASSILATTATFTTSTLGTATASSISATTATFITSTLGTATASSLSSTGNIQSDANISAATVTTPSVGCDLITTLALVAHNSIVSNGTVSFGTNSLTCGPITASGTMSCGTNSLTSGQISCNGIVSTASINLGGQGIQCGPIGCGGITSTACSPSGIVVTNTSGVLNTVTTSTSYTPFFGEGTNSFTTSTNARYLVDGPRVTVSAQLTWSSKGSAVAGNQLAFSLPLSVGANCPRAVASIGYVTGITFPTSTTCLFGVASPSNSTMNFYTINPTTGGNSNIIVSNCGTSGEIQLSCTYWTT